MQYDNVNFNAEWAATKSTADFIEHENHNGLSDEQLKEVHKLCIEVVKATAKSFAVCVSSTEELE
jgi:hypothetical protein